MNKYLQGIYLNIFFSKHLHFSFHFNIRNFFLFCYSKTIYVSFECKLIKVLCPKIILFLKPASESKNYHEFNACIKIVARIGIGIKLGIVPSPIIIYVHKHESPDTTKQGNTR